MVFKLDLKSSSESVNYYKLKVAIPQFEPITYGNRRKG